MKHSAIQKGFTKRSEGLVVTQKVLKIFVNCKHDGCYVAATMY